jgi:hypothetical protein
VRLLLLIAAGCASPSLVVDGLMVDGVPGRQITAMALGEDRLDAVGAGWAIPLGANRWLVPRHCWSPQATHALLAGAVAPARKVAAGSGDGVAQDWVVVEVASSGGNGERRRVRLTVGDSVSLPPSLTPATIVDVGPGLIAVTRGDAAPGWSGRPVVHGGVVIGSVHGADGDRLLVLLLPEACR